MHIKIDDLCAQRERLKKEDGVGIAAATDNGTKGSGDKLEGCLGPSSESPASWRDRRAIGKYKFVLGQPLYRNGKKRRFLGTNGNREDYAGVSPGGHLDSLHGPSIRPVAWAILLSVRSNVD